MWVKVWLQIHAHLTSDYTSQENIFLLPSTTNWLQTSGRGVASLDPLPSSVKCKQARSYAGEIIFYVWEKNKTFFLSYEIS